MRNRRFGIIALLLAFEIVAASVLCGVGAVPAQAATLSTYRLTATGQAASYPVGTLVDVSGKTQEAVNAVVATAITGMTPIAVTLATDTAGDTGYDAVRIAPVAAGPHIQLWAKDTANNWYDINAVGWGPPSGFPLPVQYSATTDVYLLADMAGDYPLTITLVDVVNGNATVALTSGTVRVGTPMAVSATVPTFIVGQQAEFTVTTVANDDAGKLVRAYFTIPAGVTAEYYEVADGKWYPLPNSYGPETGFPVASATSRFRATFAAAGEHTVNIQFKTVADGAVLADYDLIAMARAPEKSAYEFFLEADGVVAGQEKTVPVSFEAVQVKDEGYNAVRFNVRVSKQPAGSTVSLKATDTNGQEFDVVQVGFWGPAGGFPINKDYSATTDFRALFSKPGDYTIDLSLYDVEASSDIMTKQFDVTVGTVPAAFVPTDQTGIHAGKVFEEYQLKADDRVIDLSSANVESISVLGPGAAVPEMLTPDTDSTLWFNVQHAAGDYVYTVVDKNGVTYEAKLSWTALTAVSAVATGQTGTHETNQYAEYKFMNGNTPLDLSSFTAMYQIKPDGSVRELTANSDKNLWFKTNGQLSGTHTFLVKKDVTWYKAIITVAPNPPSGGGDGVTPTPQPVNSNTGAAVVNPAAGGTVSLGTDVSLQIPAGALGTGPSVNVAIQEVAAPPAVPSGFSLLGTVYEFTVANHNHFAFSAPVTLTFTFDPSLLQPGQQPSVHYYDEAAGRWVDIGGTVSGNTIVVTVDHFTRFAVLATPAVPAVRLSDIAGHWAEANITRLVSLGAVDGYPDRTFRPENRITRAEFVTILVKALKLEPRTGTVFADTGNHWAKDAISTAAGWGIVDGYGANRFGPDDPVTREQLVAMVVRALKLPSGGAQTAFGDQSAISDWASDAVAAAVAADIIGGYPDGTFRPAATATRAEAATVLAKAIK
ncbi:MAG: S-layer homology domain-containing protein [Chloroflexota bacterium]